MKLIYKLNIVLFFIANFLLVESIRATDFAITFNVSHYQGGNNISCNGAQDGMVEAVIVGGTAPYIYSWNTGSYNRVLTGIGQEFIHLLLLMQQAKLFLHKLN